MATTVDVSSGNLDGTARQQLRSKFDPAEISLLEAGPTEPYRWLMTHDLVWTGVFRRRTRRLTVPGSPPFKTDLASVPRCLTWLFPRYGKYTKAAVVHDYLCQNFRNRQADADSRALLPLRDRSDA